MSSLRHQLSKYPVKPLDTFVSNPQLVHREISVIRGQASETKTHVEELRADGYHDKVRNWLAAPDPSTNFNKSRDEHHEGTGQWLLNSEIYTKWKTEQNSFLWLYGMPGCGKTTLSSSVILDVKQSGTGTLDPISDNYTSKTCRLIFVLLS